MSRFVFEIKDADSDVLIVCDRSDGQPGLFATAFARGIYLDRDQVAALRASLDEWLARTDSEATSPPRECAAAEPRAKRLAQLERAVRHRFYLAAEDIEWLLEQIPEEWPCPDPDDPAGCYCPTRSGQHLEGVS